jgi:cytolysin-activating lysine-acyltransferase
MSEPERKATHGDAREVPPGSNGEERPAAVSEAAASATPLAAATPAVTPPARDAVLGQVVWLMMQMPAYRHVFLADLEWMVMPPVLLNQFRLFRVENRIVAFAAWAYLSEAVEKRLQEPNPRLAPVDWKSGDRLWLIHLFAPFGHTEATLVDLEKTTFAGKAFKMHRTQPDGTRIVEERAGAKQQAEGHGAAR